VVVGVLGARLERVVVDVAHGEARARPVEAERLELEKGERAGGVLREGLVDPQRDLPARGVTPRDEVRGDDLFRECLGHTLP